MGILDFLIEWGGTQASLISLQKQDPEDLGKKAADFVDKLLSDELGEQNTDKIKDKFEGWFIRFTASFLKQLRKN